MRYSSDGRENIITLINPGEIFGEMAFLDEKYIEIKMSIRFYTLFFLLSSLPVLAQNSWDPQSSGVTVSLDCIKVVDQNVVWAAGDSGKVIRTINGGMTWTSVDGGNFGEATVWNIDALDSNNAFVTITPSPFSTTYIYRTVSGGNSWDQVFSQDGGFINDIHMINNVSGIAYGDPVGGKWTVIRTMDGGSSWNRIPTEPTPNGSEFGIYYNSLCVTDSLHIWFLDDHRVYRSIDGGITWSYSTTTNYFLSIWFNTNAVGMASTNVINTSESSIDSGKTWNSTSSPGPGTPYAMAGSGTRDFWYASDGYIYHTTNNGSSWTEEMVTFSQFFAMDFVTIGNIAFGYVAGTNGAVARYEGTVTSINGNLQNPTKFILEQNYPNPFNPTTTINYEIPIESKVTLKIYDLLGNEIMTLVNEIKNAGRYETSFDATSLASGIYFYKLDAGNNSEIKKLILLK